MDIWLFGRLNQLFIKNFILELNFQKNKVVSGKTPFFVRGQFFTPHTLAFDSLVLYGNVALSIVVISIKKRYSSFLKKAFVFQKTCFKV